MIRNNEAIDLTEELLRAIRNRRISQFQIGQEQYPLQLSKAFLEENLI